MLSRLVLGMCCLATTAGLSQAALPTFDRQTYSAPAPRANQARWSASIDLNKDRATDIVTTGLDQDGVYVLLANGDGSFQAAREYTVPGYEVRGIAVGEVNGDGNADVLASVIAGPTSHKQGGIAIFYGRGDGTLTAPVVQLAAFYPDQMAVLDLNGDGKKDVLVTGIDVTDGNFYACSFTNNGDGTFSYANTNLLPYAPGQSCCNFMGLSVADFDGDGHPDFVVERADPDPVDGLPPGSMVTEPVTLYVFYGDGAGHFVPGREWDFTGEARLSVADMNLDGRSDIVLASLDSDGGTYVQIWYGNADRTFSLNQIDSVWKYLSGVEPADFNGDESLDIAFEGTDANATGTWFALQQAGAFAITKTGQAVSPDILGDFDRDGRPDLAMFDGDSLIVLLNTTAGGFSNFCPAPVHGIAICHPTSGSTNTSPAYFKVSAADFAPIRKMEVWVDGVKLKQKFYSYFDYSYLTSSLPISGGNHTATVIATNFDHSQMRQTITFVVGLACAAPATAGVAVCAPVNNSTVAAGSIHVKAVGKVNGTFKRMEVWVDGVKKYSESASTTLDTNLILGTRGKRRFDFYMYDSVGQKWQATSFATVN